MSKIEILLQEKRTEEKYSRTGTPVNNGKHWLHSESVLWKNIWEDLTM